MDAATRLAVTIMGPTVNFLESLSFIGVNTYVVKHPAMDKMMADLSESAGMDETLIKYTVALFLAYPLAAGMYALPNKHLKHLYSFLVGFIMVQWIFGPDWIHSFISAMGTYLICLLFPKNIQHYAVFIFVMGYMTGSHMYRMYVSYMSGVFDFTGTQMVLTMKLTSFAYNYFDGTADYKRVFPDSPYEDKKKAFVYAERRKFAITTLPNPLEFFGYVYCFTCILAGPAFEYRDYERAIDGSAYTLLTTTTNGKTVDDKSGQKSLTTELKIVKPSTLLPGLSCLLISVICLVSYLKISSIVTVKQQYDPVWVAQHGYIDRYIRLVAAMFNDRLKFYFAWKVAEGASIFAGFGFEGYKEDGTPKGWNGVQNIDIIGFETATNIQTISRAWNKRTQGWLERYTYHRTGRSLIATYFISALWHGLYPGFFFMFMTLPLITNIERLVRAKINPLIIPGFDGRDMITYPKGIVGQLYWVICWALTMGIMNYVVQVFSMGSLENCLVALGGHYFIPHIALVVFYGILEIMPSKKQERKKE